MYVAILVDHVPLTSLEFIMQFVFINTTLRKKVPLLTFMTLDISIREMYELDI